MMTMEELVAKLNEASEAYYNGKEIMTNKEFDDLMDQLKAMEKAEGRVLYDSPTVKVGFAPVDNLPKFTHTYPALSLDKTKDIDEFVDKFYKGIEDSGDDNDAVVLMWKEDGSTVQAYYNNGRLEHLVTRGNGEVGSDITHNAPAISGIPTRIPFKGDVVVRGEALISYDDFNAINERLPEDDKFKNPRNLAAASIQMLDPNEVTKRHVVVKAFNLVHIWAERDHDYLSGYSMPVSTNKWIDENWYKSRLTFSGRLKILDQLGFFTVERYVCPVCDLKACIEGMTDCVKDYIYPVDGLVAAMDNYEYASGLEGTEHHPNIMQGYAFKWADEVQKTVLREIEWSPSRTGLLNPVAIFDAVEIDGTTVQRASLHNLSIIRDMNIRVGDSIGVIKANLIIPMIVENYDKDSHPVYTDDDLFELIGCCPTCGEKAGINKSPEGILTAFCPNVNCPEKMIGKLAHFCERDCMDIQGMSEETIKKLVEAGFIKEYSDFFLLGLKPDIQRLPGFGNQSWIKLCDAALAAQTNATFVKFITALSIPNIGKGQAKTLYKYISDNYEELCSAVEFNEGEFRPVGLLSYLACAHYDFTKIDGFGHIMSEDLTDWLLENFRLDKSTPETRVYGLLNFVDEKPSIQVTNTYISGKSFCITGKLIHHSNRQELVAKIESFGGKWVDSVSSKTDYLINNDVESTSGKNKKAHELGIPIISEESFLKMIEG